MKTRRILCPCTPVGRLSRWAGRAPTGSRIEIDADRAAVIRRIFALYLDGLSLAGVAKKLNADAVPPPRVHQRNRRIGWKDTTIRAILHNETYVGSWRYKSKEWRKLPETNKRRYSKREDAGIIVQERPHLRIVDQETWEAVRSRLEAVSKHYTKTKDGRPKGRSVPGRSTPYLFSSLLYCGACGGKMIVSGGTVAAYRCEGHTRRGVCTNALSVRESVVRASLLDELRHRLASDEGILRARQRLAERLGELARGQGSELRECRARLDKIERDIAKLLDFITEGHGTKAVSDRLKILERQADVQRKALAALERVSATPIALPTPDKLLAVVFDLERTLTANVTRGREELRRLFRSGRIDLMPQPGGFYVAKSEILPLVLLTRPPPEEHSEGPDRKSWSSAISCAGAIRALNTLISLTFEKRLVT